MIHSGWHGRDHSRHFTGKFKLDLSDGTPSPQRTQAGPGSVRVRLNLIEPSQVLLVALTSPSHEGTYDNI
jgi:hypothetical protein